MDTLLRDRLAYLMTEAPTGRSIQASPGMAVGSFQGPVRTDNQDRAIVARIIRGYDAQLSITVAVVCDGMGGMLDGGAAASLAASTFIANLVDSSGPLDVRLGQAIRSANAAVYERFHGRGGTTLTALALDTFMNGWAAHVGDSRLYHWNSDTLNLVTVDDTIRGIVRGSASPRDEDQLDNQLVQFVGIGPEMEPHILPVSESKRLSRPTGGGWLLTSDGAHSVGRGTLQRITATANSAGDLARKLMFVADAIGADDNASVIVVSPDELSHPPAFRDGTTLYLSTPLRSLEMWLQETTAREIVEADSGPTLQAKFSEKRLRLPRGTIRISKRKQPEAAPKARKTRPLPPDTPRQDGPQLKITFGDKDRKDD